MATEDNKHSDEYFSHFLSFSSETTSHGLLILIIFFFFSLILIVTFLVLHFYFRNNTSTSTSTGTSNNVTSVAIPAVVIGLDAATIDSIPIFLHGSLSTSTVVIDVDKECSICLGMFEDDEMVKVLPECLHAYHSDCVDKWLRTRSSCPLCRSSLDSTSTSKALSITEP